MEWVTISRPRSFRFSPTQSPNTVWLPTSFKTAELAMTKDHEVDPPSATLLALEGRGLFDMASLATAAPFLTLAPRGTRHAVIVLPGLGADDRSTVAIRGFLSSLGYDVHGWSLGRNVRPSDADMPAILAQISRLRAATNLPVSLVGWSRGGIMAREAAREIPAAVRMV